MITWVSSILERLSEATSAPSPHPDDLVGSCGLGRSSSPGLVQVWLSLNVSSPDQIVPFMSGPAPASGTNFAHITNSAYSALAKTASATNGSAGCADWLKGETELVKAADVIPFANQVTKTFGNKARFTIAGELVPTSISDAGQLTGGQQDPGA